VVSSFWLSVKIVLAAIAMMHSIMFDAAQAPLVTMPSIRPTTDE